MGNFNFTVFAIAAHLDEVKKGMSGGDRILLELAVRFTNHGHLVTIYGKSKGIEKIAKLQKFRNSTAIFISIHNPFDSFLSEFYDLMLSLILGARLKLMGNADNIIYSPSTFLQDLIPCLLLKIRYGRHIKWIVGFYLFPPSPFSKDNPYKGRRRLNGFLLYVMGIFSYAVTKLFADGVWVTNDLDRKHFVEDARFKESDVLTVKGGVDTTLYKPFNKHPPKVFDAIFVGRFHPQKGVIELMDIWKSVCDLKPHAKLGLIGVGYLEDELQTKIERLNLGENVKIMGFKDGMDKVEIFKVSKVFVHPVIYDSGGMAAAEAMACGLPCVCFDLESLRTYYPYGCIKIPKFNRSAFAKAVVDLLDDNELYERISSEAIVCSKAWDWEKKAVECLNFISGLR